MHTPLPCCAACAHGKARCPAAPALHGSAGRHGSDCPGTAQGRFSGTAGAFQRHTDPFPPHSRHGDGAGGPPVGQGVADEPAVQRHLPWAGLQPDLREPSECGAQRGSGGGR